MCSFDLSLLDLLPISDLPAGASGSVRCRAAVAMMEVFRTHRLVTVASRDDGSATPPALALTQNSNRFRGFGEFENRSVTPERVWPRKLNPEGRHALEMQILGDQGEGDATGREIHEPRGTPVPL